MAAAVAAVGMTVAVGACGSSSSSSTATTSGAAGASGATQVSIDNFLFAPAQLTIKVGTTVTWTNKDNAVHTVEWKGGAFPTSANLIPRTAADTYKNTFTTAGSYPYICGIHPYMKGTITVVPRAG